MRKQLTKIVSGLMFLVFLYWITPREFLHNIFANHRDSVENYHEKGVVIRTVHTHCSFLNIVVSSFLSSEKQYLSFEEIIHYTKWTLPIYHFHFTPSSNVVSLRGPPMC
ncbi:MAG TPA: hypothetical protein VN721_05225 [Flavipsychrobacter sp.]|nr:hypothetical protein [Flavipsychrobacter sp.]